LDTLAVIVKDGTAVIATDRTILLEIEQVGECGNPVACSCHIVRPYLRLDFDTEEQAVRVCAGEGRVLGLVTVVVDVADLLLATARTIVHIIDLTLWAPIPTGVSAIVAVPIIAVVSTIRAGACVVLVASITPIRSVVSTMLAPHLRDVVDVSPIVTDEVLAPRTDSVTVLAVPSLIVLTPPVVAWVGGGT
jgi:hypothetical protein